MFEEESIWIKNALAKLDLKEVRSVLDVGSSTFEFRTSVQPFIDENIFKPLRFQKKKIYYLDIKKDNGVDIVCDISDPKAVNQINKTFDLVICANLLEHVQNVNNVINNLKKLIKEEGYLLVSVPHFYFYHEDSIDTMYRPDNKELELLFPEFEVILSEIVQINDFFLKKRFHYLKESLTNPRKLLKNLPYFFKKFEVSYILLRK